MLVSFKVNWKKRQKDLKILLLFICGGAIIKPSKEVNFHENEENATKGGGTMSAYTQNFVYEVGKKKQIEKDPSVITQERLKAIKAIVEKYRSSKK